VVIRAVAVIPAANGRASRINHSRASAIQFGRAREPRASALPRSRAVRIIGMSCDTSGPEASLADDRSTALTGQADTQLA
jgi:hypothetical protein